MIESKNNYLACHFYHENDVQTWEPRLVRPSRAFAWQNRGCGFFSTSCLPVENVDVGHSLDDETNQQETTNLAKNTNMSKEKPTINIVVIGNASVGT